MQNFPFFSRIFVRTTKKLAFVVLGTAVNSYTTEGIIKVVGSLKGNGKASRRKKRKNLRIALLRLATVKMGKKMMMLTMMTTISTQSIVTRKTYHLRVLFVEKISQTQL